MKASQIRLYTYKVSLGSGTRTVQAGSVSEALEKATFRPFSRFTQTGPGEYKDTAAAPGHQSTYNIKCTSKI
jgi:hypothetical protein